jgi:hypothetical protein
MNTFDELSRQIQILGGVGGTNEDHSQQEATDEDDQKTVETAAIMVDSKI